LDIFFLILKQMINALKPLFFFLFIPIFFSEAQKIEVISSSISSDSSFYDICKIADNEFWIAGEHGILKSIDSTANVKSIQYVNQGKSIYKMLRLGNYVYLAADNGTIYKFNATNHQLEKAFTSNKYKNHCFYDLILSENGKLIACGGKSKIIKSKLTLPSGFIIEIDTSLSIKTKVLWKNKFNFVWSLAQNDTHIYASAFNGRCSKILIGNKNKFRMKKKYKFKALIPKIYLQGDTLWICGSNDMNICRNGFIGNIFNDTSSIKTIFDVGCVWNMFFSNQSIVAFTNNGNILSFNYNDWVPYDANLHRPIYATKQLNSNSILMVGNGKTVVLLKNPILP